MLGLVGCKLNQLRMEKQDIESQVSGEKTPLKSGGSDSISGGKKVKAKVKAKVIAKAKEKTPQSIQKKGQQVAEDGGEWKLKLCFGCFGFFSLSFLVFIVYKIVWYYIVTFKAREETDHKEVIISEQWIDYLSPTKEQVNCTNSEPCRNWDCSYVKEHFHKDLSECEYEDYMNWVTIGLVIWLLCMIRTANS